MSTKLDRLNELLAEHCKDVPYFRREVDRSGANLTWLQKKLRTDCEEIKELLSLSLHDLIHG